MMSEVERGFSRGRRALHLARESGAVAMQRACLGNLGNLYFAIGDFDKAVKQFEMANAVCAVCAETTTMQASTELRGFVCPRESRRMWRLLDRIDESLRTPRDHVLYGHRYSKLTRTQLLAREGRLVDALGTVEGVVQLAADSGGHLLNQMALLTKAELLQQVGNVAEAMKTLDALADTLAQQPPELFAHYDRILACTWPPAATSKPQPSISTVPSAPTRASAAHQAWSSSRGAGAKTTTTHQDTAAPKPDAAPTAAAARNVLQSVAALLRHHGRPELVARELVYLIGETASTQSAPAPSRLVRANGGAGLDPRHLRQTDDGESVEQRLPIGFARDRSVELDLHVKPRSRIADHRPRHHTAAPARFGIWSAPEPNARSG
mgnify:CR=1 FL=1